MSLGVAADVCFPRAFIVSGFSIGYRKDAVRSADAAHMLSAALFRDADLKVLAIKAGDGVEWGVPSLTFDQTQFDDATPAARSATVTSTRPATPTCRWVRGPTASFARSSS